MKLTDAIKAFLKHVENEHCRATALAYQSDLRQLPGVTKTDSITHLTEEAIGKYFALVDDGTRDRGSLARRRAAVSSLIRWGMEERLWTSNPLITAHIPKYRAPKRLPRPYSQDEARRLLTLQLPAQEDLIRALLFLTGLRVTPICRILIGHLQFKPPQVRVLVKGAKIQDVVLHPELVKRLERYIPVYTDGKPQSYLLRSPFHRPMHRKDIEQITQQWGKVAGVPDCTPHRFRHTFATDLLESCGDIRIVQEALGHADIKKTMLYTQVRPKRLSEAIDKLSYGSDR